MQFNSYIFSLLIFISGWMGSGIHTGSTDINSRQNLQQSGAESVIWARQVMDTLSLDEKLGQLFMIPAYSNKSEEHTTQILKLILEEKVGGIIMMQGGPVSQTHLTNVFQNNSDLPLLISQDSEWGAAMRLDSVIKFPRNMLLGAIRNDELIYRLGKEIALQCKAVGVQINFSPVADINNNSNNPVINDRSFGEDKFNVARKSIQMMKGLQDGGIMACAKHFPGHGDTDTDSHLDLPVIHHSTARMDSLELYPFKEMIRAGVQSVMVAHLYLPAYDASPGRPSTVSPAIVDSLLRKQMGFKGLIFTDALNMKGLSKFYKNGDAEVQAILAGNDVLLFSENVRAGKQKLRAALDSGYISLTEIENRVMRILIAKHELGLARNKTTDTRTTLNLLNRKESVELKEELYRNAITLASDPENLFPLDSRKYKKVAYVSLGGKSNAPLLQYLRQYAKVDHIEFSSTEKDHMNIETVKKKLAGYDLVITGLMGMERSPARQYGVKTWQTKTIEAIDKSDKKQIICVFGNPYALKFFSPRQTVLVAYDEEPEAQKAVAEGIFGSIILQGQLPVSAGAFTSMTGITTRKYQMEDALPEETGMSSVIYRKIDSLVQTGIQSGAMPGCAVLVQHKGKTILARGYGSFRYGLSTLVDAQTTRYDLASVTKVCATTLSLMKLYETELIHPDSLVQTYLPELTGAATGKLSIRSLLLHQSGLPAFIPIHAGTMFPGKIWKPWIYSSTPKAGFTLPVCNGMYQSDTWPDSVWHNIRTAKVSPDKKYVYSDLGMIILGKVVERVSGKSLDVFADSVFYKPLGMLHTGFCPWKSDISAQFCPPTEMDKSWRKTEVRGFVHDQTSAMLNGVAGHAGLFSTAGDLGILMHMLMQNGTYQGDTLLQKSTIDFFTRKQKNSRRGLGWDKPGMAGEASPCSKYCSSTTYGHTGFTGTCVWADPEKEIVFIFLSNRTFPDAENRKLIQESIRTKIQDIIYNCVISR